MRFATYLYRTIDQSTSPRPSGDVGRTPTGGSVPVTSLPKRPGSTWPTRFHAGKLAIQASAGTGKTYTLTDLATRFLAEGRASASELLIVTFTRAATNELRSRVRDRVVAAGGAPGGRPPRSAR